MTAINKAAGQTAANMRVLFQLLISSGTVSISKVSPVSAAADISVSDGGAGLSTVTIKNFKGPQGAANIQLTPQVTSTMAAAVSVAYTGDNLAFIVSTENDASTLTDDVPVDVVVEAY